MIKKILLFFIIFYNFLIADIKLMAVRYKKTGNGFSYNIMIPRLESDVQNMNEINSSFQKIAKFEIDNIIKEGKEMKKLGIDSEAETLITFKSIKNNFNILSISMEKYISTGGAHGITTSSTFNFCQKTGQQLAFTDIFIPEAKIYFENEILKIINEDLEKNEEDPEKIFYFENPDISLDNAVIYFENDSIVFKYPHYILAPYSSGMPTFRFNKKDWQLLILPGGCPPSTFSVYELNFQVRNVTGCTLIAIVANQYSNVFEHLKLYSS